MEKVVRYSQKLGYTQKGTFVVDCVRYVIENIERDGNTCNLTHSTQNKESKPQENETGA